jgi:hypothetical protein
MIYEILDAEGNVINTVVANEDFVSANYENYRSFVPLQEAPRSKEDTEREWRDSELAATDKFVPVTDHPQHAEYLAYRQALRDWPTTEEFPDTRPTLGI